MKKILLLTLTIFVLAACSSTPKIDLSGEWELVSYGNASSPTPAVADADTSFKFESGQLNGNAGCNSFGGSYEVKGNTITFGAMMSTMMFCEKTSNQEQGVLAVFADGANLNLQLNGNNLTITSPDGSTVVNLIRK